MVEVGTTNRTYAVDYERAINAETAAILKVHPSNFNITGFVHAPALPDLATIARAKGLALIEDQGSGALIDPSRFGLTGERPVWQSLDEGVDLITMSCDKLLGGPQGGIIAGKRSMIDRIARHPLARAVRADKTTLAGVAETLRHYARGEATMKIPVWRMISTPMIELEERGRRICAAVSGLSLECVSSEATVGGGTLPGQTLPSLAISPILDASTDIDIIARQLRLGNPGVFSRITEGKLLIDLRTILPEDDHLLVDALIALGPALECRVRRSPSRAGDEPAVQGPRSQCGSFVVSARHFECRVIETSDQACSRVRRGCRGNMGFLAARSFVFGRRDSPSGW